MLLFADGLDPRPQAQNRVTIAEVLGYLYLSGELNKCLRIFSTRKATVPAPKITALILTRYLGQNAYSK